MNSLKFLGYALAFIGLGIVAGGLTLFGIVALVAYFGKGGF